MILRAIEKYGPITTENLSILLGIPEKAVEHEIMRLWQEGKICSDKRGKHYVPPKTSFATWLLVAFLILMCGWMLVGLLIL